MLVLPTAFVLGIVIGRWWAVPLAALAWFALTLAFADEGGSSPPPLIWALQVMPFAAVAAAVGVVLHWLLFKPEVVASRARAGAGRLWGWMRVAAARRG